MKTSPAKAVLVLLVVVVAAGAVYFTITNLSFFDINQVSVENSAPVTKTPVEVYRITSALEGQNIFSVRLSSVRKQILQTEAVSEVSIKRWFPDRLVISIKYEQYLAKVCNDGEYFLCSADSFNMVSKDVWDSYTQVREVSVDPEYCRFLKKWGYDSGFFTMLSIVTGIESSLISNIIYVNDNGNEFGRLILSIRPLGVSLYVCEPVSAGRVDESVGIIREKVAVPVQGVRFDLYQGSLVRRAQEA